MDLGAPIDVRRVGDLRSCDREIIDGAVRGHEHAERSIQPQSGDRREVAAAVRKREDAVLERVR